MITDIKTLQEKWPNPVTLDERRYNSYCVGGAFCAANVDELREANIILKEHNFPNVPALAKALRRANSNLDVVESLDCASRIIIENDGGNFKGAWARLEKGLNYKPD